MTFTTTRRAAIAAGLAAALSRSQRSATAQLGRIDEYDPLSWLPALPGDPELFPTSILTHADMAAWWKAKGIDPPRSLDDETSQHWIEIAQFLPVNDGIMLQYLAMDWDDMVGFSLWDADQVTVANDPPDQIRLYHGSFDPERIADRLKDAGFETDRDGDFVLLTNPSEDLDPSADLGRFTLGNYNHLAASESLVIACRSREAREAAMAVGAGDAPSLADQPDFSDLADEFGEMTGYLVTNGSLLGPGGLHSAEPIEGETIAAARLLIGGITVEEDGQTVTLIADLDDPDAAEAAADVIADRIENETSPVSQRPLRGRPGWLRGRCLAGHGDGPGDCHQRHLRHALDAVHLRWRPALYGN